MYSVIFCFLVCTILCESRPTSNESNEVPTTPLVLKYVEIERKYRKFINSPTPCETVVPTRDLIDENVKKVQPLGVILRKCPKSLPNAVHEDWSCHSTESVNVTLQIRVEKDSGFMFHYITTTEDAACACGTKEFGLMGQ